MSLSNLNRQILATYETVGMEKALAAKARVNAIDPNIAVHAVCGFFGPDTKENFDFQSFDYVIDAIDTVTGKLSLVMACQEAATPIISSMGAGNKLDPTAFRVADIYDTTVDPLARIMRKECRKRNVEKLKVVYSTEEPLAPTLPPEDPAWQELPQGRNALPGSCAWVPSVVGLIIAGQVIGDIINSKK